MTNETVQEVETEVEAVETQVEESTETTTEETTEETPSEETQEDEAAVAEATKKQAQEAFWQRQQKTKDEAAQLRLENEYLKKKVYNEPPAQTQPVVPEYRPNPNEPTLDAYLDNGLTAEQWSRDHRTFLDNESKKVNKQQELNTTYEQKLTEYAKVNKDIHAYEKDVASRVSPAVAGAIMSSDSAAQIIEAIALDPDKANVLNGSKDIFALARNIAKFEGDLKSKPSFSGAPKPAKVPKGEPVQSTKADLSKLSKAEYRAHRNQQRK